MTLPASFANNTSPTGVQLDQNFAVLGVMGTTFCTTTGTNTITITPQANQPAVSAYTNQQLFGFTAANSSNGAVSLQVGALASLPLYLIGGAQAGSGDIINGTPYIIEYLSALNSGGGGFQIVSAVPSSAAVAQAPGSVHGLLMFNNSGTPSTKIDITGGYTVLSTTGGTPKFLASVSVTIDLTTTGANGMDTGARPTSGWVYCYIINNGSVTAGLATATSPTAGLPSPFPGGYSNFAYVGAMRCDGSQNLLRTRQAGRVASYTVVTATNTASLPLMGQGASGSISVPTFTSLAVLPFIPASAAILRGVSFSPNSDGAIMIAPNNNYGASNASATQPPVVVGLSSTQVFSLYFEMLLESANVFWAATGTNPGFRCVGWVDHWSCG